MSTKSTEFLKDILGTAYRTQEAINKQKKAQQRPFTPGTINSPVEVDRHLSRLLYLSVVAIFAFVGVEPMKVIYRKNFGYGGINPLCLAVSCFLFLILGLISIGVAIGGVFSPSKTDDAAMFYQTEGGSIAFMLIGLLYIWIAKYAFSKGWKDYKLSKKSTKPLGYLGDSVLLEPLRKEGWSQERIQWVAEPLATILIGICICLFNIFGGIPIIICGLSLWVYSIIDYFFLRDDLSDTVERMKRQARPDQETNNVE
ncbi:hypothetical protein SAMN05444008_1307 [Cnuella takakiae]|uniref:Uncharacterized protein n=1 Tax=Cnuella takakiae TaxID=1302690 RepID=A0A1M5JBT1_9BACT|nr:hypothetical protein [Cnuella takakiae]OLY95601.1 hypothetical protein BUE76_00435 [Cnuella takakiae]SHG37700.1 hypothetical protein SAMN05444008_1307 [Cnuella takakiae]